jgi:hypothetical protein
MKKEGIFYDVERIMADNMNEESLTDSERTIAGFELREMLRLNGKKLFQYAHYINKSASFVRLELIYPFTPVPFIYVEALAEFVGVRNYKQTLKIIRENVEKKYGSI